MKIRLSCLLVFLSLLPLLSAAGDAKNPFRLRMDSEEIIPGLRAVASSIETIKEKAADPVWPTVGVKVAGVYRGGNADRAGIQRGSIIRQRGEYLPWSGFAPEIALSEPHLVKYIDPDGNEKEAKLDGGPIGAYLFKQYSLGLAYLRGEVGSRNPEWDEALTAACIFCQSNQVLAESVMHFAIANGYPQDALSDFLALQFQTYSQNGPDEAIDRFLDHFETGEEIPWAFLPPLHEAAVVTGRLDLMDRIAERAGLNCVFDKKTIAQFRQWTDGEDRFPRESLLKRAIENRGPSIAHRFTSSEIDVPDGKQPGPLLDGRIDISREPNKRFNVEYICDDVPHDIHYHLKAELKATGEVSRGYRTRFLLLLANLYEDPHNIPRIEKYSMSVPDLDRRVLSLEFDPIYSLTEIKTFGSSLPGIEQTYHNVAHLSYIEDPKLPDHLRKLFDASNGKWSRDTGPITIDMIRYKCEVGIYVNGICVLHLPTDPNPTQKVDFNLHTTAVKIVSEEQDMWEISLSPLQRPGI